MKIMNYIISGLVRSVKSIKAVLTIWISTLLLVCLVALPLRSSVNSILGKSMITEKLKDGIDADVLADLGTNLGSIISSVSTGIFLVILCGVLLNVFFNGGLFTTLRNNEEKYSTAQFFRGAGIHFWPFFIITLIISLILILSILVVSGAIIGIAQAGSGGSMRLPAMLSVFFCLFIILPVLLLVADYARIWQVKAARSSAFRAIGVGFKQTFRYFLSSYIVMVILVFLQVIFSWFMLKFITGKGPQTGFGIFFLFILSQFLFIIKLILRVWRYGSVTAMFEKHPEHENS
jgi:hypothetical protein